MSARVIRQANPPKRRAERIVNSEPCEATPAQILGGRRTPTGLWPSLPPDTRCSELELPPRPTHPLALRRPMCVAHMGPSVASEVLPAGTFGAVAVRTRADVERRLAGLDRHFEDFVDWSRLLRGLSLRRRAVSS